MKFLTLLSLIGLFTFGKMHAQDVESEVKIIKYEELFKLIQQPTDQLIVVNFWATWCGPCVKEMPNFVEINNQYKDNPNFKMIFVSMDRAKQVDAVKNFITKHGMNAQVVLLDDNKRMNEWIPAIDNSWSGNIPVTAFYKNGEKVHFAGAELSQLELEILVKTYLSVPKI